MVSEVGHFTLHNIGLFLFFIDGNNITILISVIDIFLSSREIKHNNNQLDRKISLNFFRDLEFFNLSLRIK